MADTSNIEVVKMLPISSDPSKAECMLNQMIYDLQHNYDITIHEDLCGAVDPYKFMIAYQENVGGTGDATASYGVLVIEGAADYCETEKRINDSFLAMMADEDKTTSFINITHPSEYMYIAFYKIGGTATWPVVKIKTIASDPIQAGHYMGRSIETWRDDESLMPYDKVLIDENHILFLCDDSTEPVAPAPNPEG